MGLIAVVMLIGLGFIFFAGSAGGFVLVITEEVLPGITAKVVTFVTTHPWETIIGVGILILIILGGFSTYQSGEE